ncbi:MAG TPA: ATP-binding protein [Kiritimatiellia bacterium]|nr:ATP-binding protein [Kiritimatiellia bacterium]
MPHPHPIRLVLTGPESSGKSVLTEHLGQHLAIPFALEYARIYLEEHGPAYDYELLLKIGRGHKLYQDAMVPPDAPLGIFDTDLINYKVWYEVAFGRCHEELLAARAREFNHRYLLCYPDLPWEPDPLREHPNDRLMLFERHKEEIERLGRPYEIVRGIGPARYRAAEEAAARLLA